MKDFIKNRWKVLLFVVILLVLLVVLYFVFKNVSFGKQEYVGTYYKVQYDSSWSSNTKDDNLILKHRKSKGTINIYYKLLDSELIDANLEDIISDIISSLSEQNDGYKMISKVHNTDKYDSYYLIYEKNNEQSLVAIFKQDNVLIFIVYNNSSDYFDIVIDSVDSIIDSLEIFSGER